MHNLFYFYHWMNIGVFVQPCVYILEKAYYFLYKKIVQVLV
jgi:hypothetical protein